MKGRAEGRWWRGEGRGERDGREKVEEVVRRRGGR